MAGGGEVSEEKSREMVSSSAGFCYSEVSTGHPAIQTHMGNQIPGFVSDPDMFNFTTSMDMIGFSKNLHPQTDTTNALMWKTFLPKAPHHPGPSSSKTITDSVSNNFYPNPNDHYNKAIPDFASGISETTSDNLIHHDSSATWQDSNRLLVDDSSLRCVFPCEGNERPSQGLSLSLSSSNPLSIGLQSFELRHTNDHAHAHAHPHQHQPDFVSSASRDKLLGKSVNPDANILYQPHYVLKNSKYLAAAQELLYEFCSLGTKQSDHVGKQKSSSQKNKQWEDDNGSGPSKKHPVGSLEFVELQKRKTKLLSMLEEVERRYRHYCSQMKGVVSSFEAVAGSGSARVYSALALKAMSRHFRCLKDGILGELEATRRSMGEKDPVAPGTTKGETPRLRILDQALRQQRAFQQMSMMESHPWRPQRGLPERSVSLLRAWLFEHFLHPYPSDMDKHILARQTGLSRSQVSNWFINARVRLWKPMVEEMYLEEVKEQEQEENNMKVGSSEGVPDAVEGNTRNVGNAAPTLTRLEDQKPIQDQRLLRIDSDCVSSIINNDNINHPAEQKKDSNAKNQHHNINNDPQGQDQQCAFGCVELDFSSYTHNQHSGGGGMVSYSSRNENFSSGGVSLTLGLQQQGGSGSGVSLAFPPPTHQGSLFYARDQMEECQGGVHYSLLDAEPQNLPYRNLMGAQLLHDLAG